MWMEDAFFASPFSVFCLVISSFIGIGAWWLTIEIEIGEFADLRFESQEFEGSRDGSANGDGRMNH